MRRVWLAVLGCSVAWSAVAGEVSPARRLPEPIVPQGLGVNIHFTDPRPGEMEMLAAAGFRWVRMDFTWQATERRKGEYDFRAYDRLMEALDRQGIRALFILDYGNPLYDQGMAPCSDEGRQAFARWAAAAARHFRNRGILWEMWNEPNIFFWRPKPDVKQYIQLARAVGQALRQAEPQEMYIGPATSQIDFKFLEACFQAGLLEYWDAVSVHPYRQKPPETVAEEYQRLRALIDHYAPKGKSIPILSGEWGYSAVWKNYDEDRQGRYLARQFLTNLACGVPLSIWYDWHDDGPDPKEPEHHFGTVRFPYHAGRQPVYDPKPAYQAAKTLATVLDGFRFAERVPAASPEDYVYIFARDGQRRIVAWTTADKPHDVVLPLGPGKFRAVGHLGQSLPPVEAGGKELRLRLAETPLYLIPQ